MSIVNSAHQAEQEDSEELLPLTVDTVPGIYYVLLQSGPDTVSIARESYDEHIRAGDALYLAPQDGTVRVIRAGKEVARITTA